MKVAERSKPAALIERWQAAWPPALAAWSRYTRLHDPRLCTSSVAAAKQGLHGSFAMIRLTDQSVVIDLAAIAALGLEDYGLEILAHEIGHHVLAPANVTDQFRLLARIRAGLPTLERHAPMVANLYADLIINDRLQRQADLRLADIFRRLAQAGGGKRAGGQVWNLYLRIYENLWCLESGALGARVGDEGLNGDAWLGARLARVYANDWLAGAGRFAALLLSHLVADEDEGRTSKSGIARLLDATDAAEGAEPSGGLEVEADEIGGALHPAEDPRIAGEAVNADDTPTPCVENGQCEDAAESTPARGQTREPFEYGEILRSAGIKLSEHEIAIRYYRERALPYLVPFLTRQAPDAPEPQLEGLEVWDIGAPLDDIDWLQSVMQSPRPVPGMTTVRRQYGTEQGRTPARLPVDLDLYVDSSGSMPDPRQSISYPSLAGAIVALSALRAGSAVQVTLWSGKDEFMHTAGFTRDENEILRILTEFYGGATCFPIHGLRDAHANGPRRRPVHLLMISDDGITTMFDKDERGNDGWKVAAAALAAAGGGGTMALNIDETWKTDDVGWRADAYTTLRKAHRKQGWEIHAVPHLEGLVEFARAFSRRHYT
jgi:hypothetical protein